VEHLELMQLMPGFSVTAQPERKDSEALMLKRFIDLATVADTVNASDADLQSARALTSAHVLPLLGWDAGDRCFSAFYAWRDGLPLSLALHRARELQSPASLPLVGRMMLDALSGLTAMHRNLDAKGAVKSLIHGGLNQDSLWITFDGQVKLSDVGLASVRARGANARAARDLPSDVYACGTLFFWMLTGQAAVPDAAQGLDPRTVNASIPPAAANVVQRATHPSPALRPSNAMVLAVSLESAAKHVGGLASHQEVAGWLRQLFDASYPLVRSLREALVPFGAGMSLPGSPTEPPPPAKGLPPQADPQTPADEGAATTLTLSRSDLFNLGLPADAQALRPAVDAPTVSSQSVMVAAETSHLEPAPQEAPTRVVAEPEAAPTLLDARVPLPASHCDELPTETLKEMEQPGEHDRTDPGSPAHVGRAVPSLAKHDVASISDGETALPDVQNSRVVPPVSSRPKRWHPFVAAGVMLGMVAGMGVMAWQTLLPAGESSQPERMPDRRGSGAAPEIQADTARTVESSTPERTVDEEEKRGLPVDAGPPTETRAGEPDPTTRTPPADKRPLSPAERKRLERKQKAEERKATMGTLSVKARPWAKVWVNGKPKGKTPVTVLLKPGTHRVRIENKGLRVKRTERVVLEAGKAQELKLDLRK
jgi:hypothetical protein